MKNNTFGVETEYVEFKSSTSQTSKALESLAAMLNKHGLGTVYFGVNDDGEVIGQEVGNKTIKDLSDAITSRIKPQVIPEINVKIYDGKVVIVAKVEGDSQPYSADGHYLIRSGSENKKIPPEKLKDLIFTNTEDIITKLVSSDQSLTFNQIKQLFISKKIPFNDDTFLENEGFYCKNGEYNLLANILSDNNDVSIKVARFAGKDKSELIVRNEYGYKCMILAMLDAMEYVISFNETRVQLSGKAQRDEIKLFDESSFREAWINACLHNRWSSTAPPAIYLFSDRMEIISTGGLQANYTLEEFYAGVSKPVNAKLQKIMGQLDLIEQTGFGVPEIIKHYGKEAFKISDNFIIVTLRFPFELTNISNIFSDLTISQKTVLKAISDHPTAKSDELIAVTGLKRSRLTEVIKELKELNRIERVGSNRLGYWKVK